MSSKSEKKTESLSKRTIRSGSPNNEKYNSNQRRRQETAAHLLDSKRHADVLRSATDRQSSNDTLVQIVERYTEQPTMDSDRLTLKDKSEQQQQLSSIGNTSQDAKTTTSALSSSQSTQSVKDMRLIDRYAEQKTMNDDGSVVEMKKRRSRLINQYKEQQTMGDDETVRQKKKPFRLFERYKEQQTMNDEEAVHEKRKEKKKTSSINERYEEEQTMNDDDTVHKSTSPEAAELYKEQPTMNDDDIAQITKQPRMPFDYYKEQPTMEDEGIVQKRKIVQLKQPAKARKKANVEDTVFDNPEDSKSSKVEMVDKKKASAEELKQKEPPKISNSAEKKPNAAQIPKKKSKKARNKLSTVEDTIFDNPEDTKSMHTERQKKAAKDAVEKIAQMNLVTCTEKRSLDQSTNDTTVTKGTTVKKGTIAASVLKRDLMRTQSGDPNDRLNGFLELMETQKGSRETELSSALPDDKLVDAIGSVNDIILTEDEERSQESDSSGPETDSGAKEPCYMTVMDILSLMCVLPLMNDYWRFPLEVAKNGGYAFVILYVIIFVVFVYPTLNLVLFISQWSQTGLVDIFELYGPAYEGFGYGYLVLILFSHMTILHDGSILLKHLRVAFNDSPFMFTCSQPYVQNWFNCSSIFLDSHCIAAKSQHDFYSRGMCWHQPSAQLTETSANSYIKYLTSKADGQMINTEIFFWYVVQLTILSGVAFTDTLTLVIFLSILMVLFFMLSLTNVVLSINSQAFGTLSRISDFGRLHTVQPWISAIRLAFSSSGLGEVSIFCMSSFRHPNGRYFTTATFVILGKLLVCFLGLSSFFSNLAILYTIDKRHRISFTPENKELIHFPTFMADVYSFFDNFSYRIFDNAEFIYIYHAVTSLAAIFTIHGIVRRRDAEKVHFVSIYVLVCLLYAITGCLNILNIKHKSLVFACSLHMYIAATIVILFFLYGFDDYRKESKEGLPKSTYSLEFFSETVYAIIILIVVIVLIGLQTYDLVTLCFAEINKITKLLQHHESWKLLQEMTAIILAIVPIVLPIAFCMLAYSRRSKMKSHNIARKYPAYKSPVKSSNEMEEKESLEVTLSKEITKSIKLKDHPATLKNKPIYENKTKDPTRNQHRKLPSSEKVRQIRSSSNRNTKVSRTLTVSTSEMHRTGEGSRSTASLYN